MKKAINAWAYPSNMSIQAIMDYTKKAGYDGIELNQLLDGPTGLHSTPQQWQEIKAYAAKIHLPIHSVASGLHWQYPITAHDPATRKKGLEVIEHQLHLAHALGADTILVVPGAVAVPWEPDFQNVQYDIAYQRALEGLQALAPLAEALQITIGIENVWNQLLLSPMEMRDFIDTINSPYVGAYFDTGNIIAYGQPEDWIRILGKRICKVHFKDYKLSNGWMNGYVGLLAGDVNWPSVMAALREIGYDAWATAEVYPSNHYPTQVVWDTMGVLQQICGESK